MGETRNSAILAVVAWIAFLVCGDAKLQRDERDSVPKTDFDKSPRLSTNKQLDDNVKTVCL
jgi:hypothetical protein